MTYKLYMYICNMFSCCIFVFNSPASTAIYTDCHTLSLHVALPISDATARVAAEVGLLATVGLIVFDFPSAWGTGPDDYLHKGMALHDQLKDEPLIRTI